MSQNRMNNAKVSIEIPMARSSRADAAIDLVESLGDGGLPPLVGIRRQEGSDRGFGDERHRLLAPGSMG
ncbi:hypothetical protein AC628_20295 [Bradyrhizobium sp. NAS96.2]|nr:hypothetical protein AC628_20295 [Bradyrhizobium sp. NAS96.2]